MRPFLKLLGARVKQLREERSIGVRELADTVGYDRSALYQLERGTYTPGVPLLVGLAAALEVEELDFLVFPGVSVRADVIELTRSAPSGVLVGTRTQLGEALSEEKKPARARARSRR